MAGENKMDLMAKLPDEILMQVFSHLPSLRDKLRVEGVSHRFQRCLIRLMNTKPQPLEFNDSANEPYMRYQLPRIGFMNKCYPVTQEQLSDGVKCLANKSKFSRILLRDASIWRLNSILSALVNSDYDCLDKVTSFQIWSWSLDAATFTLLDNVLAKCTKLSELRLYFHRTPSFFANHLNQGPCPIDLDLVLKDKELAQLSLVLQSYSTQQVVQLFESIKPNMLKQVDLQLQTMTLDMDMLVTGLCGGAWSALEQLNLRCQMVNVQMDALFSSLAHLPALRKCDFELHNIEPNDQLVAGLTTLFKNNIDIKVIYSSMKNFFHLEPGCHCVPIIRQVQAVHPDLEIGFCQESKTLTLALGKVSFEYAFCHGRDCGNDCPDCAIFYPTLIRRIASKAAHRYFDQGPHLANGRLDRCRIGTVVADLNKTGIDDHWNALHAGMNEEHNLATITFEWNRNGTIRLHLPTHSQFQVTVDCGCCLSNCCFGCIHI